MGKYGESNLEKVMIVFPEEDGTFTALAPSDDPFITIVRRFGIASVHGAISVSADAVLHTPTVGSAVRLKWIYLATPKGVTETVVTVNLGTTAAYKVPLPSPGVFMKSSIREGAVNETLSLDLSVNTTVYVNYELEEF